MEKLDVKKQSIYELKKYLNTFLKYYKLGQLDLDYIYDDKCKKAVEIFQNRNNLNPNGIVNKDTWYAIFKAYKEIIGILNEFSKEEYKNPTSLCYIIQAKYMNLSKKYKNIDELNITGECDVETVKCINQLQAISNLECTGKINFKTWKVLIGI